MKKINKYLLSLFGLPTVFAGSFYATIRPVNAFKLNTHATLGQWVYEDAKDGKVSIRIIVEPGSNGAKQAGDTWSRSLTKSCEKNKSNEPQNGSRTLRQWPQYSALERRETCSVTKEYPVAQVYKDALLSPNGFNAFIQGTLGPDVYPDMLTGQKIIHPHENNHDATTAQWLAKIYWMARVNKTAIKDPSNLAFALGYTFHAIADIFAHSLVNKYAGGPFAMGENAVRHIVVEGTIAKFVPNPSAKTLSARLNDANLAFVYSSLIKAGKDEANMYSDKNPNTDYSVPFIFESLRLDLKGDERTYKKRAKACDWYDPTCSSIANNLKAAYVDAWQKDITSGLKAWPRVSEKAGVYFGFNETGKMKTSKIKDLYSDYSVNHILSMSGAPDALGYTVSAIGNLSDLITPKWIKDKIKELKKELANYIIKEATGKTIDQWEQVLSQDAKDVISDRTLESVSRENGMERERDADQFISYNEMWVKNRTITTSDSASPWITGPTELGKVMLLSRADLDNLTQWINENACAGGNCYISSNDKPSSYKYVTPAWWASENCTGSTPRPVYGSLCVGGVASIDDPSGYNQRGKWAKPWFIQALFEHIGPIPKT